jgi:hypothetical protein
MTEMKLHQLSNGDWIDLRRITHVMALRRSQCFPGGPICPDRVVVYVESVSAHLCVCDDWQQAEEMRDELARLANS